MKQFLLALFFAPMGFFAQDQKTISNQKNATGPESGTGSSQTSNQKGVTVSDKKNELPATQEVINTNTVGTVSNKKDGTGQPEPKK